MAFLKSSSKGIFATSSDIVTLNGIPSELSLYPVNILKLTAIPFYMTGIIEIELESTTNANNRCGYNRD